MKKSSKIVFFGNERLSSGFELDGAPTLQALIDNGYTICAVVSHFEPGRSRKARKLEIEDIAHANNIPILLPNKPADIKQQLIDFNAKAGVLVAYGKIVPQSVIDIFPRGIVNIHPSLLPLHRGPTPIEQAILDGTPETGVSLMALSKEMDAGPIYHQERITLQGNETKQELTQRLLQLGGAMLIEHLPGIIDGSATPQAQDDSAATYTSLLSKANSPLDIKKPASVLEREIRAYAGWPKSTITLFGKHQVVVLRARVAMSPEDGALVIPCGQETFLEILELTAPSGRRVNGADFLRGYKN